MRFPIVKQEDESLALEVPDDLLQQLTSTSSSQAEAQQDIDQVVKFGVDRTFLERTIEQAKQGR